MSATDVPPTEPATACPRCGAPLRPGQEWCLNCGSAVATEVAGPPGWRAPVAIVAVVLAIAAGALVYAFLQISDDADRVAQAPAPTAAPSPAAQPSVTPSPTVTVTPSASPSPGASPVPGASPSPSPSQGQPTPSPTPATGGTGSTGGVAGWPAGRDAWTVILFSATTRPEADAKAKSFSDQGKSVGVLHSDDYSSLRPGYWVVFSGQYDRREDAQAAAEGFGSTAPGAYARKVTPK